MNPHTGSLLFSKHCALTAGAQIVKTLSLGYPGRYSKGKKNYRKEIRNKRIIINEKNIMTFTFSFAFAYGWRSLVGCSPWGPEESDTTERLHFHFFTFMHWRRKWQPTPVFLPGESKGRGSLVGCHLWGHTESDTTESDLAAAAAGNFWPSKVSESRKEFQKSEHMYLRNWISLLYTWN